MIFFVSDTHFGHHNIRNYCGRPFENTKDMDDTIITNINRVVKPKDVLYFLGDFCHKGGDPQQYLDRIDCKTIHFILGNHDNPDKIISCNFATINSMTEIIYRNQRIILCHYPMRSWSASYKNSWMLYGHVHGRLDKEDTSFKRFTFDVGVDNKREGRPFGTPWSFKELQQTFKAKSENSSRLAVDKPIRDDRMS